jgi:pilus assembly protein Flp/PilA
MSRCLIGFRTFLRSEDGPTTVEYAVLMALIVIALITVVSQFSAAVSASYGSSVAELDSL